MEKLFSIGKIGVGRLPPQMLPRFVLDPSFGCNEK